jgi:hypothetical protein
MFFGLNPVAAVDIATTVQGKVITYFICQSKVTTFVLNIAIKVWQNNSGSQFNLNQPKRVIFNSSISAGVYILEIYRRGHRPRDLGIGGLTSRRKVRKKKAER